MANKRTAIDEILNPRLKQLYDYWLSLSDGGRKIPPKSSFDPVDIPKLLSSLIMTEFHRRDGMEPRLFVRLVGTDMVKYWGSDSTGKYVDEVQQAAYTEYLNSHYHQVDRTKRPSYWHYILRWEDGHLTNNSRLYLPFCTENEPDRVSTVIVGQVLRHDTKMLMEAMSLHVKDLEVIELDFQEF